MKSFCLVLFILISFASLANTNEEKLLQLKCSKSDLPACENLTAYYVKNAKWDNAYVLGEALCSKEVMKGCTFAGSALLAKEKAKEGIYFLTKACDGFEPFACRSLARLMKQNREELASYMYNKRACYYGLSESCKNLKVPKETYSTKGLEYLKEITDHCEDSNSSTCQTRLNNLQNCAQILSANDCLLIPGELSIFFRAKLIQESAKLSLMNIVTSQNLLKEKSQRYSYDLKLVLKDQKALNSYSYVFGFKKNCTKMYEKTKNAESTSLAFYPDSYSLSSRVIKNISAFFYKQEECYDPKIGHEAFAVANLDPLNPARLDIWKTNRDGNIVHLQNGLPVPK